MKTRTLAKRNIHRMGVDTFLIWGIPWSYWGIP